MIPREVRRFHKAHRADLVCSLYIDGSASDPADRRAWRVRVRQEISRVRGDLDPSARVPFERALQRLMDRLPQEEGMPGTPGWAGFCSADGDCCIIECATPIPTSLSWGTGPRLLPLLEAAPPAPALLALVDSREAVIARIGDHALEEIEHLGTEVELDEVGDHMGDAPRLGFHGGTRGETRTDAAERVLREARHQLERAVMDRLLARRAPDDGLILGGPGALHVIAALPRTLDERVVVADALRLHQAVAELREAAMAARRALGDRRQLEAVRDWQERAFDTGRAAVGLEGVAEAARQGAVESVLVSARLAATGGATLEALLGDVLTGGGDVGLATGSAAGPLDAEAGGIAAALRFPLPQLAMAAAAPRALLDARGG